MGQEMGEMQQARTPDPTETILVNIERDQRPLFPDEPPQRPPGFWNGVRRARWALIWLVYLMPSLAAALLLAYVLPGGWNTSTTEPTLTTLLVTMLAAVVSFVWAALRDGPQGVFGKWGWLPIVVAGYLRAWTLACRQPGQFTTFRLSLAGHTLQVGLTVHSPQPIVFGKAPVRRSLSSLKVLWTATFHH